MTKNPKLISISGFKSAGKDTIGDFLCSDYGFKKDSFAAPLKDATAAIFGWDRLMLEGDTDESREWREETDQWWSERLDVPNFSPRRALQLLGTETLRQGFHNDIWQLSLENRFRNNSDPIVVTDCRFPNELDLIKQLGGITISVIRDPKPDWWDIAVLANTGTAIQSYDAVKELARLEIHASEYSWVGFPMDYEVENNGTIDDLFTTVDKKLSLSKGFSNDSFQQPKLF